MIYFMFYGLDNITVGGGRRYKSPQRRVMAAKRFQKRQTREHGIFFLDVDESAKPGFRTSAEQFDGNVDLCGAMTSLRLHYDYVLPGIFAEIMRPSVFARRFAKEQDNSHL